MADDKVNNNEKVTMETTTLMKAAFCQDEPRLIENKACYELRQTPIPTLDGLPPGSLLLETVAASICGTDLFGQNFCRQAIPYLNELGPKCGGSGHELLGRIIEIVQVKREQDQETATSSHNQDTFKIGDIVLAMAPTYIRKMTGLGKLFEKVTKQSKEMLPDQGGFAEYFVSHECCCLPIPNDSVLKNNKDQNALYYHVAAQPLGTIIHALRMLNQSLINKNIAIVGQGPNGLIMTQMIANLGAKHIIVLDLVEERLKVAASKPCGATHTIHVTDPTCSSIDQYIRQVDEITQGEMCHIVIEMVGHQNCTIRLCNELTQDGGTVLLFGILTADGISIHVRDFARNLKYACSSSPDFDDFVLAMDLISQGRFDPLPLFSHVVPFERFPKMYAKASEYEDGVIKILLTFGDE